MYSKLIISLSLIFLASISIQCNGKYLRTSQIDLIRQLDAEQESGDIDGIQISCTLLIRKTVLEDHMEEEDLECELHGNYERNIVRIENIPEWLTDQLGADDITSGEDVLNCSRCSVTNDGALLIPNHAVVSVERAADVRRRLNPKTTGNKEVLVIYVEAGDASTTTSMDDLSDYIFGINANGGHEREINSYASSRSSVTNQFYDCSRGKFVFNAFQGTINDHSIPHGVLKVIIDSNVVGVDKNDVENEVTRVAKIMLGVQNVQNGLGSLFDHVIISLPRGTVDPDHTAGWYAYGYINHYISVFNSVANYYSFVMHEVGHNLNLGHSGENDSYGDKSGMMGYSYAREDWPKMCFNAVKTSELGWFNDGETQDLDLADLTDPVTHNVYGLYAQPEHNNLKMIKITLESELPIFISFNLQTGPNIETQEGANEVLVHHSYTSESMNGRVSPGRSNLLVKLNNVDRETFTKTLNGGTVEVEVDTIGDGYATVTIRWNSDTDTSGSSSTHNPNPTPFEITSRTSTPSSAPRCIDDPYSYRGRIDCATFDVRGHYCDTYGELESNGTTPSIACCVCGGGELHS